MISSGIKRGLAASAVSALAVAGLPLLATSANAQPLVDQLAANAVVLYTPDDGGAASIKNDGVNTTVHLLANAGSDASQVRFEFGTNPAGPFTTIATVSRTNGAFATEWTPPTSVFNLPVHVRAVIINNVGNDGAADDNTVTVTSNQDAINLAEAEGSAVGVFQQPYAASSNEKLLGAGSATTSDVADDPAVTFSSPYNAAANDEDTVGTPAGGSRSVSGPVDYTGYNFGTATDADQAIEEANVGGAGGGSDAEAVTLYKQTITTVTAVAAKPTVQAGSTSDITVTVTDQNGKPVVGAQVFQDDDQNGTGDAAARYTNSQGQVTFTGQSGSTGGTTHYFFVNTTDDESYQNGVDFKRSATVTEYTPVTSSITPKSADGPAFDDDENAAGDISVTVKDQNGNPSAGQVVRYAWTVTPFEATTGYPKTLSEASATTNGSGVADIPFPTSEPSGTYLLHTYINRDGTPGQQSGDLGGTDLTVKAGQADIVFDNGTVAQAQSNTTTTVKGKLVLEDGTALAGRNIALSWAPTGNAVVANQGAQPAGTTRTSDTAATTTTGADGSFGVALADPPASTPPGPQSEKGGVLTGTTANTPNIGNAGDSSSIQVDFLRSIAPAAPSDITVDENDLFSEITPGRPVDLDITVKNADGDTLTDYPVTVSVDHGFLSPDAGQGGAASSDRLTPDPAPAEGSQFGEWKSTGATTDFTTNDSGATGTAVAIEKDAGFDTSDTVKTVVTVVAGGVTKKIEINFESIDPLNGGSVSVERAAASKQTVSILPKAPTAESVYYDVFTTDQFGNLVDGVSVDLTDTLSGARLNGDDNNGTATSQLKNESPALELDSDVAGDQTPTGSWTAPTSTYKDADAVTAGFQADGNPAAPGIQSSLGHTAKTLTDAGETVNWYVIDFANSVYSMTHDTADTVPVGSSVLETYTAIDQNGEPIQGVKVGFFRTGPDQYQDGDFNSFALTNSAGQASYVFAGAAEGTATVQGLITDYSPQGGDQIVPESRATDTVTFSNGTPPPNTERVPSGLVVKGYGHQADDDTVIANAIKKAAGAEVTLYKVRKDGTLKKLLSSVLNAKGNHKFKGITDKNGTKVTKYKVKITKTDLTKKGGGGVTLH